MILESGSKILVAHRRLFDTDGARFFVGTIDGYEAGVARATGYSWVRDLYSGKFIRKNEQRTKIFAVGSGTLIVYSLPNSIDMSRLKFEQTEMQTLLLDGASFKMDLSETEHEPTKPKKLK